MELAGVRELVLLAEEDARLEDQRLFLNLAAAYARLEKLVERVRPEAIATLAYEGGHPDHDSCSVLGARLGEQFGLKVWEAPLYWRGDGTTMQVQRFICESGDEAAVEIDERRVGAEAGDVRAVCVAGGFSADLRCTARGGASAGEV